MRLSDDVGRLEALPELGPQTLVLLAEAIPLLLGLAPHTHRVGDHRGNDRQHLDVLLEIEAWLVESIDAQRAVGFVAGLDRYADERDVALLAAAGTIQEQRRFADLRNNRRLAGLHHFAGHTLAELVPAARHLALAHPVRQVDRDVSGLPVEQGDRAMALWNDHCNIFVGVGRWRGSGEKPLAAHNGSAVDSETV